MDALEKRALEIFAQWHADKGCGPQVVRDCVDGTIRPDELTMELLRMALTLPEGYVLVPVEPTEAMLAAGAERASVWLLPQEMRHVWAAMLAARQPVASNQPSGNSGELDVDGSRQPVGKPEPVAVIENGAFGGGGLQWIGPMPPIGTKLYAAPPAQAVDLNLEAARHEGYDCAIRYVLGYFSGTGNWASTQYEEILNNCGRESIIRSAINEGELEFTGLGRWVAEYGTDAEKALLNKKAEGK